MSKDRDEILADFQACTGMEDVTRAISILEENNWDLVQSVNEVMPQESQSFHSNSMHDVEMVSEVIDIPASPVESATDMLSVGNNVGYPRARSMPTLEDGFNNSAGHQHHHQQPSTSASTPRQKTVHFNVQFGDRIVNIDIPDTGTIADIKSKLYREFKIPPCQQLLSGWARHEQFEHMPIKSLMAPNQNALNLTVKPPNGGILADQDNNVTERLKGTYVLKIKNLSDNNKEYSVNCSGTKTILEVKNDVYTFTNIHVRNQIWTGWPPNIDDQTMLALSGINYPEHELTVRQNASINHSREKRTSNTNIVQIDSDDEEYEDASESFNVDDDIFVDNVTTKRVEPLIPETIEDEIVGSLSFVERFSTRYGAIHPQFYQGTLEDALKEACQKPAKDKKILGIYLHHDASVLSNVFCTQLLGVESVMQVIERNFIFWGWDLTFESNRTRLQNSVNNCMGSTAAMSLRDIPVDKLPAIIIIMKVRSSTDIYNVIYGNVGINELLSSLIEAVDVFTDQQRVEVKEEQERAERELVKWEQDMAYRESLEADRAKEEAKRLIAEAEAKEKLRMETERSQKMAEKEAYRREVEASLPPEPSPDQGDSITQIRFRLPNGKNLERMFLANTPLKVLLDYLTVQGYPINEFKVISSWPRRDLTSIDNTKTLQELKLCPKETVILEER